MQPTKALQRVFGAALAFCFPEFRQDVAERAMARELDRRRGTLAVIAGSWEAADRLLVFAKQKATQLALHSPYTQIALLTVLCDEITRRAVYGLTPEYIMERLGEIETVADLQRAAVLATLAPETLWEEPA